MPHSGTGFSGFVPLPSDGSDPAYCSSQSPVPSGWLLWCGQLPHPSPAFRPFSAATASSVSAWIQEDTAGLPQQVSSPGYLPAKIPDILIKGSAGVLPDLHPYTAALLRQSVHLALKYSVYHNTGSREVSHVLFLQIVQMCNTHPFSSTVLSPHPAFLLSYSVHRSSGKKFLPCLRQSLTLSASWYSCFLPDL